MLNDGFIDRQLKNEGEMIKLVGMLVNANNTTLEHIRLIDVTTDNLNQKIELERKQRINEIELERKQRINAVKRESSYNDDNLARILKLEARIAELENRLGKPQ
jgi:hypothetical protein